MKKYITGWRGAHYGDERAPMTRSWMYYETRDLFWFIQEVIFTFRFGLSQGWTCRQSMRTAFAWSESSHAKWWRLRGKYNPSEASHLLMARVFVRDVIKFWRLSSLPFRMRVRAAIRRARSLNSISRVIQ